MLKRAPAVLGLEVSRSRFHVRVSAPFTFGYEWEAVACVLLPRDSHWEGAGGWGGHMLPLCAPSALTAGQTGAYRPVLGLCGALRRHAGHCGDVRDGFGGVARVGRANTGRPCPHSLCWRRRAGLQVDGGIRVDGGRRGRASPWRRRSCWGSWAGRAHAAPERPRRLRQYGGWRGGGGPRVDTGAQSLQTSTPSASMRRRCLGASWGGSV